MKRYMLRRPVEGFRWLGDNIREAVDFCREHDINMYVEQNAGESTCQLFVELRPDMSDEVEIGSLVIDNCGYALIVSSADYEEVQG